MNIRILHLTIEFGYLPRKDENFLDPRNFHERPCTLSILQVHEKSFKSVGKFVSGDFFIYTAKFSHHAFSNFRIQNCFALLVRAFFLPTSDFSLFSKILAELFVAPGWNPGILYFRINQILLNEIAILIGQISMKWFRY